MIYVYFNHKDLLSQSLSNLIGSLIRQLAQYHYDSPSSLEDLLQRWEAAIMAGACFEQKNFLEKLHLETQSFERVYVIIDALDECLDDSTRNQFLQLLQGL